MSQLLLCNWGCLKIHMKAMSWMQVIIAFTYCVTMKHVYMSTVVEADVCEEVLSMCNGEQSVVIDSDIRDMEELLYNSDGTSDSGTFQCICLFYDDYNH